MIVSFWSLITPMRNNDGDVYRLPAFLDHTTMARQIPPGHTSKYFRIVFTPIFLLVNEQRIILIYYIFKLNLFIITTVIEKTLQENYATTLSWNHIYISLRFMYIYAQPPAS